MSMSLTNAKIYVARILGGAGNPDILAMAAEAIQRAYTDWQNAKVWNFLLKDTSNTTAVSGVNAVVPGSSVNAPTTGAFDFVNVGQTVTISAGTATLAAGTTVSSVTRDSTGVITAITFSNALGGTTNANATLTFSADIPLLAGVADYNLPNDYQSAYTLRLTDNENWKIDYIEQRTWDWVTTDQTIRGVPEKYTTYNPLSPGTQNDGTERLRVFKTPDRNRTARLRYFRKFNASASTIDVPAAYIYQFLDYARSLLLGLKIAQDNPQKFVEDANAGFAASQASDELPVDDEESDARLKSPYEQGARGNIVNNGAFDPYPY